MSNHRDEETYSSDEEASTSTPRSGGHIQFNDRNIDLCLMEVEKIAGNKVLYESMLIQKQLKSKQLGSLRYRITDCLERNISLRSIHAEYDSLYGELKELFEHAQSNLDLWEYNLGKDEEYEVASGILQQAQKKFDVVRAQPEDILEDLVENEKSTLVTVIGDYKKWYEQYIPIFGFTIEGQKDLMEQKKMAWRFRYIYHINDILNETFVDDLTSIDKYVSIYFLLRCIDSVNTKLTKGEYTHAEGIPELMNRLRDALGRVGYNTSMRKLYVQTHKPAAVLKEFESSMEKKGHAQIKSIHELSEKLSRDSNEHRSDIERLETELRELRLLLPGGSLQGSVEGGSSDATGDPDPPPDPPGGEAPPTDESVRPAEKRGGPKKLYNSIARAFSRKRISTSDRGDLLEQLREMI